VIGSGSINRLEQRPHVFLLVVEFGAAVARAHARSGREAMGGAVIDVVRLELAHAARHAGHAHRVERSVRAFEQGDVLLAEAEHVVANLILKMLHQRTRQERARDFGLKLKRLAIANESKKSCAANTQRVPRSSPQFVAASNSASFESVFAAFGLPFR
jgi:hypothetical protein